MLRQGLFGAESNDGEETGVFVFVGRKGNGSGDKCSIRPRQLPLLAARRGWIGTADAAFMAGNGVRIL